MKNNQFFINSICLSDVNLEPNGEAIVAGWGQTSFEKETYPSFLQEVKLHLLDREKCRQTWNESPQYGLNGIVITDRVICTISSTPPDCLAEDDRKAPYSVCSHQIL